MSRLVIVGGGPAGAAAAITLARAGHAATLIERHAAATDKVCGDFLSGEALRLIAQLGVDLSLASTISALRLVHRDRVAVARLPFPARGLSRRALDEALLRQAQQSGAKVLRGHRISAVRSDRGSIELSSSSLERMDADALFLATGKHELRGVERHGQTSGLVGLKMYYAPASPQAAALRHHVELILFRGGYVGLQLVEADRMVLCALVPARQLRAVGRKWDRLLATLTEDSQHLRQRLTGAHALLDRPLAIGGLPYGYMHAPGRRDPPGLYRLGDQAAVIASLTGGGVSLALASGRQAALSWLSGADSVSYHRQLGAALSRRLDLASALHRLCLSPWTQPWVAEACKLCPNLIRWAASRTMPGI